MNPSTSRGLMEALRAPLGLPQPVATLGRALWLYVALMLAANRRGLVIRRSALLARSLSVSEPEIEAWIERLEQAKLLRVLSPAPFLTIRLASWPAAGLPVDESAELSVEERDSSSHSPMAEVQTISSHAGDGGQGEGELRRGIQAMLPEADDAEIERILDRYPRAIIRKALERVARTGTIRKSKTALFRYLLAKLSQTIDVRDL